MPRPKTGETPIRQVRIDDATWNRVEKAAEQDSTTSSAIVRRAIVDHLDRWDAERGQAAGVTPT